MITSLSLQDVVPALRADLPLGGTPPGRGEAELHFSHPHTGKMLSLKGVEISVARMLDGSRTAGEVIAAAAQIGIPVKLPGLNAFIHKLENEGLLAGAEVVTAPGIITWSPRADWSEEVRGLFQAALRAARVEDLPTARRLLDELLAKAPGTEEAARLLEWVMARLFPDVLHEGPTPSFQQFFAELERSWFAEGERRSEQSVQVDDDWDLSDSAGFPVPQGSGAGKVVAAALGLALLAGVVLFPLPHTASAHFKLEPRSVTPVTADRAGKLAAVSMGAGQFVTRGTVLATWDTATAKASADALQAKLAAAQAPKPTAFELKKLPKAKLKLAKAKLVASFVQKKLEKLQAKLKGKPNPALARLQRSVEVANASVKSAQGEVEALSGVGALAPAEVAALQTQLAAARTAAAAPPITAPSDGVVRELSAKAGAELASGAILARLEDSKVLKAVLEIPKGEELAVGSTVELALPAPVKVTIEKVDGNRAEGGVDNARGAFQPGVEGSATFAGASRSLLGRL